MIIQQLIESGAFVPVLLGLIFVFSNGFRDSSTIIATVVSTRVLSPNFAFLLCAIFEFFGAFFIGSAVSGTIRNSLMGETLNGGGKDIVVVVECGLAAAICWGAFCWWRAWPASNNQALVAGLFGSSVAAWGTGHFHGSSIFLVLFVLISSPIIGFLVSALLNFFLRKAGEWMTPKVKPLAEAFHVLACLTVSSAHGSNDTQLVMGVLGALLAALHVFALSTGFSLLLAVTISMGVLMGGRRILKKLGMKFFRIRDTEGLGAQMSSAATVLACNFTGFPASTTQVVSGSIVGAGFAKNPRAVRWHLVQEIVLSWVVTLPTVGGFAYLLCKAIK